MSNNKQSSVECLFDQLEEKGCAWENASIRRVEISIDVSEYLALKEQAKAMHKEEVIDAHLEGQCDETEGYPLFIAENHYNETYGGNK